MDRRSSTGKLSGTQGTGDILCPFFHAHGRKAIQCADIYPGSESVTVNFQSREEKEFHEETYCCGHYKKCWLYYWAMKMQWEDED